MFASRPDAGCKDGDEDRDHGDDTQHQDEPRTGAECGRRARRRGHFGGNRKKHHGDAAGWALAPAITMSWKFGHASEFLTCSPSVVRCSADMDESVCP